jgi:hypothetical protein
VEPERARARAAQLAVAMELRSKIGLTLHGRRSWPISMERQMQAINGTEGAIRVSTRLRSTAIRSHDHGHDYGRG